MNHPIDPLTPEAIIARSLWDTARENDINRFLSIWERLIDGHREEILRAISGSGEAEHSRGYEEGYYDGRRDVQQTTYAKGVEHGYEKGYDKAWTEAEEKLRAITGESVVRGSED